MNDAAEALAWRLETAFDRAWPALDVARVPDWAIKVAGTVSRRSNSANPLGPQARLSSAMLKTVDRIYSAAGQPAYVRLPSMLERAADRELERAGWSFEGESLTLIGPLSGPEIGAPLLSPAPSNDWLAASNAIAHRSLAQGRTFAAVLALIQAPAAFAAVRREGEIAAVAYGVLHDRWLCIEAVATRADQRGQGLAGEAVSGLMRWAGAEGGEGACLQTQSDNLAAQALYRRLGIGRELYRYHYRRAPAA